MEQAISIDPSQSVREVMRKYPASRQVFDEYGLLGCGGEEGPAEAVSFFARVHQVNLQDLLSQLNRTVNDSSAALPTARRTLSSFRGSSEQSAPAADSRILPRRFIRAALVSLVSGGCLVGALLLLLIARYGTFDVALRWPGWTVAVQSHAHVQLSGWVALFIMGVAYFALPRFLAANFQAPRRVGASFVLMIAGILLRVIYAPFSEERWAANWVVWGAAAEVAAAVLFFSVLVGTARRSPKRSEPYVQYLASAGAWFIVSQIILLVHAMGAMVQGRAVLLGRAVDDVYMHVTLLGFVGLYILGVTLRTVPLLLDFERQASARVQRSVLWIWNFGVALYGGAVLLSPTRIAAEDTWRFAGASLELVAGLLFLRAVNPFQKPRAQQPDETPRAWLPLVRAAYAWFVVALLYQAVLAAWPPATGVMPEHAYWGAFRHALTVGWISMMIFGMAYRMVPVMEGCAAAMAWTAPVVFWLVNLGNLGRVALQSLTPTVPAAYTWMGATGVIELAGCVLFVWAMLKTLGSVRAAASEKAPASGALDAARKPAVTTDTIVSHVLEAYPQSVDVFVRHGFAAMKNPVLRATATKMITVGQACRMHGIDEAALLRDLATLRDLGCVVETNNSPLVQIQMAILEPSREEVR